MSPTFVRVHAHTYLMVNENEYMARQVLKFLEQSSSATKGLVPASLGLGSTENVLSFLNIIFQMTLKSALG